MKGRRREKCWSKLRGGDEDKWADEKMQREKLRWEKEAEKGKKEREKEK
jgi:hypothetical protein